MFQFSIGQKRCGRRPKFQTLGQYHMPEGINFLRGSQALNLKFIAAKETKEIERKRDCHPQFQEFGIWYGCDKHLRYPV